MTESKICTCPSGDGSLRWPCPKHPAVEHERAEFEAWVRRDWPGAPLRFIRDALPVNDPRYGQYCDDALQRAWVGWQARAALAQPSPAQAEAERPEVVGSLYLGGWADQEELEDNDVELDMKVVERLQVDLASKGDGVHMPLMTVAQHERIVGALTCDHAHVEEHLSQQIDILRINLAAKRDNLDAALAEVERLRQFERICEGLPQDAIDGGWTVLGIRGYAKRLEDQLKSALARVAELDKQCRDDVARALGLRPSQERGFAWSYLLDSIKSCVKASEDAAQAQHSVPEGYALIPVRETEAMHDAVMALLYKGVARTDTQKLLNAYIAAAPGKEG